MEMRKFIQNNANVFARLDSVERRQITFESKTEKNFEKVFRALEAGEPPKQGIFYEGQVYDAYTFACDLIRKAKESLKDLGKKWFAFSKFTTGALDMLKKLGEEK
ncbi:MAG: hypothetical protein U5P10_08835 [Spirochaetia bacterium]|nr:hypothetical protein [Spirochaetia bacterium]